MPTRFCIELRDVRAVLHQLGGLWSRLHVCQAMHAGFPRLLLLGYSLFFGDLDVCAALGDMFMIPLEISTWIGRSVLASIGGGLHGGRLFPHHAQPRGPPASPEVRLTMSSRCLSSVEQDIWPLLDWMAL